MISALCKLSTGVLFGLLAAAQADAAEMPLLGTCGITTGGFLLPGTDACLKIGGYVRAEGSLTTISPRFDWSTQTNRTGRVVAGGAVDLGRPTLGASARLTADLHLPTEAGPVRVFMSLRGHNGVATDRLAR